MEFIQFLHLDIRHETSKLGRQLLLIRRPNLLGSMNVDILASTCS